jgi:hypothetical protein
VLATVTFVLVVLALARVTRAVTTDLVGVPLRRWAVNGYGERSKLALMLHCPWCTSMWLAIPAAIFWGVMTLPPGAFWLVLPAWPAMSYIVGLLHRLEGD